jgi:predicted lipoprotein with Yx(FWY)xxD motif
VSKKPFPLAAPAIALAMAIAGCGGSSPTGGASTVATGSARTTPGVVHPGPGAFVSLASVPRLGLVLVDAEGHTLYGFDGDRGGKPNCYRACARTWPPLLTDGAPQTSNGTSTARLDTTRRRDGQTQVTYGGYPLYSYGGDKEPGEANGQGAAAFGGRWFALEGTGKPAG